MQRSTDFPVAVTRQCRGLGSEDTHSLLSVQSPSSILLPPCMHWQRSLQLALLWAAGGTRWLPGISSERNHAVVVQSSENECLLHQVQVKKAELHLFKETGKNLIKGTDSPKIYGPRSLLFLNWETCLPPWGSVLRASDHPLAISQSFMDYFTGLLQGRKVNCLDSMSLFSSQILLVSFSKQNMDKAGINRHVFYHIFCKCFRLTDNRVLVGWNSDVLRILIMVFLYVVSANKQADQHIFYFCNFITNHVIKY